jgi:alkanesulfonate monooxygenase SsuD/methylene tetrahydromethanopterin reductase-like flavin-dependent oxidoreductase (luciferase family)
MRVGVNLPHYGAETSPAVVQTFAKEAESAGLCAVWVIDRMLRPLGEVEIPLGMGSQLPVPYGNVLSSLETLVHVAGCTDHIRLGTSVIDVFFQNPAALARRLSTVDHMSNGRLDVGLGQGYIPEEFAAANVPLSRRGRGFDEFVDALRTVWGPDPVQFEGDFYRIPRSEIGPKPLQRGGPRLLMGAASVAGASRAGRLGLGFNPVTYTWDALVGQVEAFHSAAAQAGHPPESLPIVVRGMLQEEGGQFDLSDAPLAGSPTELAKDVERLMSMGVDEIFFDLTTGGFPLSKQLDLLGPLSALQIPAIVSA